MEPETETELLQELDGLLSRYRDETRLIDVLDEDVNTAILQQLDSLGVALVSVSQQPSEAIRRETGSAMAETFTRVSAAAAEEMRQGRFSRFSQELKRRKTEDLRILLKSGGFLSNPPLAVNNREPFTHPLTNTVHNFNRLVATNNIRMWEILVEANPSIHPLRWFRAPLRPQDYRVQVSEDGVKVVYGQSYSPTGLHYDGQLGQGEGADARRIQIIYTEDTGPVRLFAVPGTQLPRVRRIIQQLTGTEGDTPGFVTLKKRFDQVPRLRQILYRYGVAVPGNGLLMFRANVWHYEAAEAVTPVQPDEPVQVRLDAQGQYDEADTKLRTRRSTVFRIYCGVVSVPPGQLVRDSIVFAYMREFGWPMEPFAAQNKRHPLFVNEKSTQFWKVLSTPEAHVFDVLRMANYAEMQGWLDGAVNDERLALYGLTRADLLEPIASSSTPPRYTIEHSTHCSGDCHSALESEEQGGEPIDAADSRTKQSITENMRCAVCSEEAEFFCADCADHFYCSEDCQKADLEQHYEQCDYENVTERVGISILGVGPWKRIVREHIKLTRAYLDGARLAVPSNALNQKRTAALVKQINSWTRQFVSRGDRDVLYALLYEHVTLVKQLVDTVVRLQRTPALIDAQTEGLRDNLSLNAARLVDFWNGRSVITKHKATRKDYKKAWTDHLACTVDYVKASIVQVDRTTARLLTGEERNPEMAFERKYERCLRGGEALGAVLNGQKWVEPVKKR